jgi:hypothetical protein
MNVPVFHHDADRLDVVTAQQRRFPKRQHTDFPPAVFAPVPKKSPASFDNEGLAGFYKNFCPGFCHWFPFFPIRPQGFV